MGYRDSSTSNGHQVICLTAYCVLTYEANHVSYRDSLQGRFQPRRLAGPSSLRETRHCGITGLFELTLYFQTPWKKQRACCSKTGSLVTTTQETWDRVPGSRSRGHRTNFFQKTVKPAYNHHWMMWSLKAGGLSHKKIVKRQWPVDNEIFMYFFLIKISPASLNRFHCIM